MTNKTIGNLITASAALLFGCAHAATVTLVADVWCPYNCEPGSAEPGFMIEIAQKSLAKAGHTVDYKNLPWSRAIDETRKGKYDGIIAAVKDDAPDFVFPENQIGLNSSVFLVRKGDPWRYTGIGSLSGVAVGITQDYAYEEEFDAYAAANLKDSTKIQAVSGDDTLSSNLKKLDAKRIGALLDDAAVIGYRLGVEGKQEVYEIGGRLRSAPAYVTFSPAKPSSAEYAKLLSDGVVELRQSGELAKILAKYGQSDWQP